MIMLRRLLASALAVSLLWTATPLPAQAGIVGTEEAAASQARDQVRALLAREDVRAGLQARGVDPAEVRSRVDALSDDEAARLAGQLDALPAGGSVVGVLLAIFVILLVTDILGLTKVFPFTRTVR